MNSAFAKYSYPIPRTDMPSDDDLRVKQLNDDELALRIKLQEESNRYQWEKYQRKLALKRELRLVIGAGIAVGVTVILIAAYSFNHGC